MRIGIVGAGGIGGFLAGALARAGIAVAIVARGAHLAAIARDGLQVRSDLGTFAVRVDASDDLRELGSFDALVLTFKAHQWQSLLPQLAPFAGTGTTIATFQNGLPFWFVREPPLHSVDPDGAIGRLFSDEQVVGGAVHVSGHVAAPGVVVQSGGLRYAAGDPRERLNARAEALVDAMRQAGLAAEIDPKLRATVWLKLVNNAGLNPVSALRRLTIKPLLADPGARAEVRALMNEALQVGRAIGAVGDVDLDARIDYAARLNDVKTSMLQDAESGRELEIEPILGAILELAQRAGVPVPRTREHYALLASATAKPPSHG